MQKSILYKTLTREGELSVAVIDSTAMVQEAIRRHGLSPVAAAALGRTLTAAAYLCSWLKEEKSSLSVSVNGGGPGGKISVAGDGALCMRGYAEEPALSLPPRADGKLDVGGFVGKNGNLTVIRDDGEGIPFVGTSPLVSGEIAEDFSAYFALSEQRPTAIALGVKISPDGSCAGAGGLFLQPMPFASEETISFAEEAIARYSKLSSEIAARGAMGILGDFGAPPIEVREPAFRCLCSRKKVEGLLMGMDEEDLKRAAREQGGKISVHCHYCNTDYLFTEEELSALFARKEEE